MGKYDDPRLLETTIDKLKSDLAALQRSTLPLLSYQKGPTPGWMNAAQVGPGAGMKSAMHLHLDGNQPGVAPRLSVTDASGNVRFEAGNLAANGVSVAQYGWRVNDGNQVPIADAIGLSQVMSQLGHVDFNSNTNYTTTTPTLIPSSAVTFSLVRTARVYAQANTDGNATSQTGEVHLFLDGVDQASGWPVAVWGSNGPEMSLQNYFSASLAAGSHTIDLRARVQNTPGTMHANTVDLVVWLLGT